MKTPSVLEMLQAGVHFGHQTSRWHPKMEPFIFGTRSGVHIIDLEKTKREIEKTLEAVRQMAVEGKKVLFISTKPQAKELVKAAAIDCGMPYLVDRWIGGLLTNFPEMKKLIKSYLTLKEQRESGEFERYTKKEQLERQRLLEKMGDSMEGLATLDRMPDALFIPAMQKEKTAVVEANRMNVAIIGVCDTNANPVKATHVIPANDDAVGSIKMIVALVADAAKEGKAEYTKKMASEVVVKAAPAPAPATDETPAVVTN